MKVFISDLHIGSPLFIMEDIIVFLYSNPEITEVYILGDIFDVWEKSLNKILKDYKSLIDMINNSSKTKVIIKGNHDPELNVLQEVFNKILVTYKFSINAAGKKILLLHGHEFDGSEFFTKLFFPIHWCFERLGINLKKWFREKIHKFLLWKNNLEYDSLVFNMEKKTIEKYGNMYDLVISGHSHMKKIVNLEKVTYINCGAVILGDYIFII